jgi:hypothetical protein
MITRQYRVGPWLGALKMQGARAMFYVGLPQTPLIAIAAAPQIQRVAPWLSVWMILLGFVLYYVVIGMWLDYVLVLPSETAYNNRQAYKHQNPFQADMAEVKERLTSIEAKLK